MFVEAFPRLAVRLRSTFPDAQVSMIGKGSELRVRFPEFPEWEAEVIALPLHEHFQIFETSILLRYNCMLSASDEDFRRILAAENLGLRGATLTTDRRFGPRAIRISSSFIGQKGRTRDEAENLAIDLMSLFRFARLFEGRIMKSVANKTFSYEMYYFGFLSKSIGRYRFINYARSIFQGSTDRVFGQVMSMIKDDYRYQVVSQREFSATIMPPGSSLEIILRIPKEIPVITCSAALYPCPWEPEKSFALVARLNSAISLGHFEVNADGSLISFVNWKHLTNDLRYFSLDQLLSTVHEAQDLLRAELPMWTAATNRNLAKANAASLNAYNAVA